MRVVYLAAGAGGMICGSCMRDNRLAATLIEQGRDMIVLPLYTPLKLDEPDSAAGPVYYGGINVYLEQAWTGYQAAPRWFRRLLDTRTLLRQVGRFSSRTRADGLGPMTVSLLRGEHGRQQLELARLIDALRDLKPDLVNLANLMFVGIAPAIKAALKVPVLCTLSGEDIFLDKLPEPHRGDALSLIRERSADVDGFIALSEYYADHAANHFALPRDRVHYAPMGVRVEDFASTDGRVDEPFTIGYFARICADKGFANACEALAMLLDRGRSCRLIAGGYLGSADRADYDRALAVLEARGFRDRFSYVGEVDRAAKIRFFQSIDAFCVPTVYAESKGLSIIEAMASGVPVVLPMHGSFPEIVRRTGGGVLYTAHNAAEMVSALERMMDDPHERRRMGAAGRAGVMQHHTDRIMAEHTWKIYERLLHG